MTDDTAARLRALAEAAHRAEDERAEAAMRGDVDGLRRSNETRLAFRSAASPDVLLRLLDERDAAMALLRECREFIDTTRDPAYPAGADLADRIDALLGDGGEAK